MYSVCKMFFQLSHLSSTTDLGLEMYLPGSYWHFSSSKPHGGSSLGIYPEVHSISLLSTNSYETTKKPYNPQWPLDTSFNCSRKTTKLYNVFNVIVKIQKCLLLIDFNSWTNTHRDSKVTRVSIKTADGSKIGLTLRWPCQGQERVVPFCVASLVHINIKTLNTWSHMLN